MLQLKILIPIHFYTTFNFDLHPYMRAIGHAVMLPI